MEISPSRCARACAHTHTHIFVHKRVHTHAQHSQEKSLDLSVPTLGRPGTASDPPDTTPWLALQPRRLPSTILAPLAHLVDHAPRDS